LIPIQGVSITLRIAGLKSAPELEPRLGIVLLHYSGQAKVGAAAENY